MDIGVNKCGEILCNLSSASLKATFNKSILLKGIKKYVLNFRQWQTLKHAYKLIIAVWLSSLFFMLPIAILSTLIPTGQGETVYIYEPYFNSNPVSKNNAAGHNKCRELWPDEPIEYEKIFNLLLLFFLLVLPLFVMLATYFMISRTLWLGMRMEQDFKEHLTNYSQQCLCEWNYY